MRTNLYEGQTFTHRGLEFRVTFPYDADHGAPWEEHDGHGVVSDWTTRDKAPGERILIEDHGSRRYYDIQASLAIAIKDGRDAKPYKTGTKRQQAARAVDADYAYLRAWCHDEWHYCGVVVTRTDTGEAQSLWGIEDSETAYLTEVAYELAEDLIDDDADRAKLAAVRVVAPWPDVR
jgi:hypothetical protein